MRSEVILLGQAPWRGSARRPHGHGERARSALSGRLGGLAALALGLGGWILAGSVFRAVVEATGARLGGATLWVAIPTGVVGAAFGLLVAVSWAAWVDARRVREGYVRILPLAPTLRFVPSFWARSALPATSVFLVLPALVRLAIGAPLEAMSAVAGGVGAVFLLWTLVTWRRAPGLEVSPEGVFGVRGSRRVALRWEELRGVATSGPDGRGLVFESALGASVEIGCGWIGSDPAEVALVIAHFAQHPEDRELLEIPLAALQRVCDDELI